VAATLAFPVVPHTLLLGADQSRVHGLVRRP
jgi:hypothetical protein